jgi:hypothetical protein
MPKVKLTRFKQYTAKCNCPRFERGAIHKTACPLAGKRRFTNLEDDPLTIQAEAADVAKSNAAASVGGLLTPTEEIGELFPSPGSDSVLPSIEKPELQVALAGRVLTIKFTSTQKFKDIVTAQPASAAVTPLRRATRNAKASPKEPPKTAPAPPKRKRQPELSDLAPPESKKARAAPRKRGGQAADLIDHPYRWSKNVVESPAPIILHDPNLASLSRAEGPEIDDETANLIFIPTLSAEAQWLCMTQWKQERVVERINRRLQTNTAVNDWFLGTAKWRARVLEYDARNAYDRGGENRRRAKADGPITFVKGWGQRTWADGSGHGVYEQDSKPPKPKKKKRRA